MPTSSKLRPIISWAAFSCLLVSGGCQSAPGAKTASLVDGAEKLAGAAVNWRPSFGTTADHKVEAPPTPALTENNFSEVQIALGRSHERTGNLASAEAAYRAAVRNNGENAVALHRLALVTEKLGHGQEADKLLLRAAALSPDNAQIRNDLGYWYAMREQWPEARRHYEHAIKLDPGLDRAHNNLGMLLARTGNASQALRHFEAAGLTSAEARSNLGLAHLNRQEWDHAQEQFDLALTSNPKLPQAVRLASALRQSSASQPQHVVAASDAPVASQPTMAAPPEADPFAAGTDLPHDGEQQSQAESVVAASAAPVASPPTMAAPPVANATMATPPMVDLVAARTDLPYDGEQQSRAESYDLAELLVVGEETAQFGSELGIVAPDQPHAEATRPTYEVGARQGAPRTSSLMVR